MLHESQEEIKELRSKSAPSAGLRRHLSYGLYPMVRETPSGLTLRHSNNLMLLKGYIFITRNDGRLGRTLMLSAAVTMIKCCC